MTPSRPSLVLDDPYGTTQEDRQSADRPAEHSTKPTARTAKRTTPKAPASSASSPKSAPNATPSAEPTTPPDLLAGERRQVNVQVPAELWQAVQDRAEEIGFSLRIVVADALLAAVELDAEAHADRAMAVNRRAHRRRRPAS